MHDQAQKPHWAASFFTIWIGQALSLIGSGVGGFALVWWLTEVSGRSATILATATLVAMLPGVLLGPFAGALVDRWNRRRVMIVADTIIALFSAWLAFLFWADRMQIWHVYAIMFVRALGGAFHWPAMQASTSLMVPKEQLSRVAGMNQTLQGILGIVTPPLGAFLMQVLPLYTIMAIDVITAAFAIGPLFFVHIPQPERRRAHAGVETARLSLWQDVKYGFAYIWHWKGMFLVLILATVINMLINPGMSLLPILITRYFGGGALQLGWMNSAWGLGVIVGGLTLSLWGGFKSKVATALFGLIGMGIGFATVGVAPATAFWLSLVGVTFAGFMNPITNGPFSAVLQEVVDPEIQGRVFTVVGSVTAAASPLGMAIAGPVADGLGVQVWFILGGLMCVLMGIGMFFIPAVMNIEAHDRATTPKLNADLPAEGQAAE
ncbi:MAG: MFS transporter [Anaerolineae bacterium]|nr:MFS transporter [Anaerolineae bacterium]